MKLKSGNKQFLDMKMVNLPRQYTKVLVKAKPGFSSG